MMIAMENSSRTPENPLAPGTISSFCFHPSTGGGPSTSSRQDQGVARRMGRADSTVVPGLSRTIVCIQYAPVQYKIFRLRKRFSGMNGKCDVPGVIDRRHRTAAENAHDYIRIAELGLRGR